MLWVKKQTNLQNASFLPRIHLPKPALKQPWEQGIGWLIWALTWLHSFLGVSLWVFLEKTQIRMLCFPAVGCYSNGLRSGIEWKGTGEASKHSLLLIQALISHPCMLGFCIFSLWTRGLLMFVRLEASDVGAPALPWFSSLCLLYCPISQLS